ncbi:MAG: dTDP-4-amino-4,6-dideoxyglucose formyltransferase [Oscillospiraceae bacterium]|nr:dTDP-4-amino-4,6-dideoxyglucose formyltransferase [Oscillospiraceae bacterium]
MNVCVITDNLYIFEHFQGLIARNPLGASFEFFYAPWNKDFKTRFGENGAIRPLRIKEQDETFFSRYDLFISLHCKQLFPDALVNNHLCINVHPGYNPYNRGWFPQVFGIMNHLPIGVTIHKMDTELDHGPILWQKRLELRGDDTSKEVYERILATEMELMEAHLEDLLTGNFSLTPMAGEGNLNTKQDFEALREIDPNKPATYGEVLDFLRAMTHAPYKNAYYLDQDGKKVFVRIVLEKEL